MGSEFAFYDASKAERMGALPPPFEAPLLEQQSVTPPTEVSTSSDIVPQFASKADLKAATLAERIFTTRSLNNKLPSNVLISRQWAFIVSSNFKNLFKAYAAAEVKTTETKSKLQQETKKEVEQWRHMQEGFQDFLARIKQKK